MLESEKLRMKAKELKDDYYRNWNKYKAERQKVWDANYPIGGPSFAESMIKGNYFIQSLLDECNSILENEKRLERQIQLLEQKEQQEPPEAPKPKIAPTSQTEKQQPIAPKAKRAVPAGATAESLTKRGYLYLEESDWEKAAEYFDNALDIDPEYAPTYIGLLCAELKITCEARLENQQKILTDMPNFKRAIRYADSDYRVKLEEYSRIVEERVAENKRILEEKRQQEERQAAEDAEEAARRKPVQDAFDNADKIMTSARSPDDYRKAITAFGSIDTNYQDINTQIKSKIAECEKKIEAIAAEFKKKYGVLLDRLSAEGKAQAGQRRQAAQAQLDEENKKAQTEVDAKCEQIQQKFDADHKAWQDEHNRLKAVYNTEYKKWETETNAVKAQSEQWNSQGLCPHCGGKLKGLFTKKCSDCGKEPSEPIKTSSAPVQPKYPAEPRMPQTPTYMPRRLEAETDFLADVVATVKREFVFVKLAGIDWRVLAVENNRALLISEKILEERPYNVEYKDITWENCTLRKYLNNKFYNHLGAAKPAIAETRNINPNNQWYGISGGKATTDKVFLLSLDEVCRYFGDSTAELRNVRKDEYFFTDKNSPNRIENYGRERGSWWWLRSPGYDSGYAARVNGDGNVGLSGTRVGNDSGGVRPAMWLKLGPEAES